MSAVSWRSRGGLSANEEEEKFASSDNICSCSALKSVESILFLIIHLSLLFVANTRRAFIG